MRIDRSLLLLIVIIVATCVPVLAQKGIAGTWEWKSPMDKDKRQTYFSITIKPRNGKVAGTYFFNDLENGETESDGAVAGYIGTVSGNSVMIEFDPEAGEPGYTENVRYKRPRRKLPATATLTLVNDKLEWTQTRGKLGDDIPNKITLRRTK